MTRRMVIAALALMGLFVATYLGLYKLGIVGQLSCAVGSCEVVNTSKWAMLFGQPVAFWGVGFYVATLALALVGTSERLEHDRRVSVAMVALSGVGVLFSAWLTYLELAVIHAVCMYCVISACLVVVIFGLAVVDLRTTE
ncbi:MAG: vitamin K epoxide reductase family protein [Gemmatimonadaceae bacterium]